MWMIERLVSFDSGDIGRLQIVCFVLLECRDGFVGVLCCIWARCCYYLMVGHEDLYHSSISIGAKSIVE